MSEQIDDAFGALDADGWYEWMGDRTMRPAGKVDIEYRHGNRTLNAVAENFDWHHDLAPSDIVKWRPVLPFVIGRCANKHCQSQAREISPYCDKCEPDL